MKNKIAYLLPLYFLFSCDDDEMITVEANDLSLTIEEIPRQGSSLGFIDATTNSGSLTFSVVSQNPPGGLTIDMNTGELVVLNGCVYDFETIQSASAVVEASNGGITATANVSLTITDVTEWNGPTITFTKLNNVDINLAENQDRMTDNVWITRDNTMGIFNIKLEPFYTEFFSPNDTEWAFGLLNNACNLEYNNWEDTHQSNPQSLIGKDLVVYLKTDNIYLELKFLSWQCCAQGGGFSYERSTP